MILSKEQINRYLRHIIIPEISGQGQKKITESKTYIYASNVNDVSPLVYYLAASGMGCITCCLDDKKGYEELFKNVNDLNGDVNIELVESESENRYEDGKFNLRIIICKYNENKENLNNYVKKSGVFMPALIIGINGWEGFIKAFTREKDFNEFIIKLQGIEENGFNTFNEERNGNILSPCFAGAFTAVESIKLCLNLGTTVEKGLYFNLLSAEFKMENTESDIFSLIKKDAEKQKSDNEFYINKKLSESRVLIIGAGGLGSPVTYALSKVGVGNIGIMDYDTVEISNLNRQILHSTKKIGMTKVESAKEFVKRLNPEVNVTTYYTGLSVDNVRDIIKEYDVVVDAVDNFPSRYLLNDACYFENKILVDAAAVKFSGLIMTIIPGRGACYRCTFPSMPAPSAGQSCKESGVLGPVPGIMGFLEAAEVVKLLAGTGELLNERIVYYEGIDSEFVNIKVSKSPDCKLCGEHPTITELVEYQTACENK